MGTGSQSRSILNKSSNSEQKNYSRDAGVRQLGNSYRPSNTPTTEDKANSMYVLVNRMREENAELRFQLTVKTKQCEEL